MKKTILELVEILNKEKLTKVSYENKEKDSKVKIVVERQNQIPIDKIDLINASNLQNEMTKSKEIKGTKVNAPIVGTFYESAGVGKKPFVKLNDKVKKGQTLFILEAMKVMNEIKAPHDGKIVIINVKNEQLVEYDQTIMVIE